MSITLQDFASGDTNYVAKFNSNNDVLEAAVAALQALTSGAAFSAATVSTAYAALFGSTVAVIGDDSYVCSDAGGSPAGNLSVTSGYCYRPSLNSVLSKATSTTLGFNGQSAATYYVVIDSLGEPTRDTVSTEAIYSVVWTGSAFGAITRLATVVWGAADWIASQTSTALSATYSSLDDRLEAIETAAAGGSVAQPSHYVYAGPSGGSPTNGLPTFRALVPGDLPIFVGDTGGSPNSSLAGAVPVANQGDAAAGKFLKADGTWAAPAGSGGTVTSVNLTQPAAGITVSGGPVTTSGSITLALANDLSALEALSSTGYPKRTGTDTWALQSTIPAADLPTFVGDDSGSPDSSVKGAVPVANQGDAAAGKFLAADGTWKASYLPQNSKSAAYTTVLTDSGKHLLHPSADVTARTFTIDSNANVPYPIGTAITFVNQASAGVMTIAITSDTMRLAGAGTTGSRTLAANGIATALKVTSTEWIISGTNLI